MSTTKKTSSAKSAAKAKAKAAPASRRERPGAAQAGARAAAKPVKSEAKKAKAKPEPKAAKTAAKAKVKPEPKPKPAKAAVKLKPEPKAKVAAKSKPEPKAKAAKPEPKPKPQPKAKTAPKPKAAKPEPEKPAAPVKPAKPRVAPVTTKTLPIITRPTRPPVASGNGRRPIAPPRLAAPKPLSAPKPVTPPQEIIGESQPVPVFKAKTPGASASKGLVLVGAVAGAFGVKGEVRLRAFTAEKTGVIAYGPLYSADGKAVLKPKSWRELKDGVAVVAPEIKTREEAEALRGARLYVPRANLPAPPQDEFYIVDLLGCSAEALDGKVLGEIVAVWNFGAGDILEYRPPNGGPNQRVTFTKESAPLVDLVGKRVVLDPPDPEAEAEVEAEAQA